MPCYKPMQAIYVPEKKRLKFSNAAGRLFQQGISPSGDNNIMLPCGQCIGCRLEHSRVWAMRIMHESEMHVDNCFLTLTYDDDHLPEDGSLDKRHVQLFFKRLRQRIGSFRYYHCGEYGDLFRRPHYHVCMFGYDPIDKERYKFDGSHWLYTSQSLNDDWSLGFVVVAGLSFDSAAYVARYCTKKITGDKAKEHYQGRLPEYATMSRRPGIGRTWYDKFKKDCYPSDFAVVNGHKSSLPRYYDNILAKEDPELLARLKAERMRKAEEDPDSSFARLSVREFCKNESVKKLLRKYEKEC